MKWDKYPPHVNKSLDRHGTLTHVYLTEAALVSDLLEHLAREGTRAYTEFDYTRGRTDIVALGECGELFAIEAKLTRWREALHQAYRNRCFAHRSYVALPPAAAAIAGQYVSEFSDRRVGLFSVSPTSVTVILECEPEPPVQPWLTNVALDVFRTSAECSDPKRSA